MHRRTFLTTSGGALLVSACGNTPGLPPSNGGVHSRHELKGRGAPTVVFESGLGDGMASWNPVFHQVANRVRAFRYDRPGYSPGQTASDGWPSDRDGMRTGPEVARHLRATLQAQNIAPPYVLVGHSIGGTYLLAYAKAYPSEVAGVVLVDGRLPGFTAKCEAAHIGICKPPSLALLLQPWHVAAEMRGIERSEATAARAAELSGIPATLIAATTPPPGATARLQKLWLQHQRAYATTAGAKFVKATGAGHYIHRDQPGLVINEIAHLLSRIRAG